MKLNSLTAHHLLDLLNSKEISSTEIINDLLNRVDELEDKIGGYLTIRPKEELIKEARLIDKKRLKGEDVGILGGIPISVKDNIITSGILTTCGSQILKNFIPPYDATVITRIKNEGGIIFGKNNMDEFAMGSSTENSSFKLTKNPWDLNRVPGGSSGGCASALSADEGIIALGSDTGGSIRQPASFCNLVGIKPTYGKVSRYGLVAYSSSMDQIGVISKDVKDSALLLEVISGYDPNDSTSLPKPSENYKDAFLINEIPPYKIGIIKEYIGEGIDSEVKRVFLEGVTILEKLGFLIDEVSLKHAQYAVPTYYIIASAEASSNLARYDGIRYGYRALSYSSLEEMYRKTRTEGFGKEVKRRIMLGTYVLSSGYYDQYYNKAQSVRTLIIKDFQEEFKKFDLLISPVSPLPPFKIGEKIKDPLTMYLTDICSVTINLAGLPAISIPCGFTKDNLPIGMQIIGNYLEEKKIFKVSYIFESNCNFHLRKPSC